MINHLKYRLREIVSKTPYDYHGNIALHEYNALYFYIPKVACSSLKLSVAELLDIPSPDMSNPLASPHRRPYPYVRRNEILTKYQSYCRFAFVRNPWDRLLSCYKNKIVGVKSGRYGEGKLLEFLKKDSERFHLDMSFSEFVEVVASLADNNSDYHYRSQYSFNFTDDGVQLTNFIGKFESLDDDLRRLAENSEVPLLRLPHVMKSSDSRTYREFFTTKTKKLVESRYEKDIDTFKYTY
jgi:hypothetical protein